MQHIFSTRNYSVKDFAEWEEREELELVPKFQRPPPRTFGPQGPTLGELSDAYLQDYQVPTVPVPEYRSRPDRPSHRLLRPRRAGCRADHVSDPPVPTGALLHES